MSWSPLPVPAQRLGESPLWHPQRQCLYWCDIPAGELHAYHPDTQAHRQWSLGSDVACCAAASDGHLLLALRRGIVHFNPDRGEVTPLVDAPYDTALERFNDGKVDPWGRWWIGTIYEPRQPALAALYCLHFSGGRPVLQRQEASGITVSNGLAWSPDGRTQYRSDTTSHTVFRADVDPVSTWPGPWAPWVTFPLKQPGQDLATYGGRPDGAAVDQEGAYWTAMFEGQRLLRLSAQGEVLASVALPVRCATMPTFGGPDLRTLFVTTARESRPEAERQAQPWAGQVLQCRVDVPGLPASVVQL